MEIMVLNRWSTINPNCRFLNEIKEQDLGVL